MKCPKCDSMNVKCVDSRLRKNNYVHRIKKCLDCNYKFQTREILLDEYDEFAMFKRYKKKLDTFDNLNIKENLENMITIANAVKKDIKAMKNMLEEK